MPRANRNSISAQPVDRDRNGRDPMVLRIAGKWHLYYTAHPNNKGVDYARTSDDLIHWSPERVVAARGKSGDGPYSAECPFVVEPQPGHYYLFRTQAYGRNAQTMVYHSRDPLDFGIDNDCGTLRDHPPGRRAGDFPTRGPLVHGRAFAQPQRDPDRPTGVDTGPVTMHGI